MKLTHLLFAAAGSAAFFTLSSAKAVAPSGLVITEVDPTGSSASYGADWFELTNYGSTTISTSGDLMSDNHGTSKTPVAMSALSLAPGQSVIYIEDDGAASTIAPLESAFETAWFGSSVPAGFTIGTYGGTASPGLGSGGDAVNIYNSSDVLLAGVSFGASTLNGGTFDNSVSKFNSTSGDGSGTTDTAITTFSAVGVNGAFLAPNGEIGSPGAVPEPKSLALGAIAAALLVLKLRRKRA
jgi:hypothetical protein